MKKRTLIIPIVVLVLLVVFSVADVCLTTNFLYTDDLFFNRNVNRDHKAIARDIKRNISMTEKDYKKTRNVSDIKQLEQNYNPYYYTFLGEYSSELGEDYLVKCMEYSQKMIDLYVNDYEAFGKTIFGSYSEEQYKFFDISDSTCNYVWAQYMNGDHENAKKTVKDTIEKGLNDYDLLVASSFSNFFSYLCNDASVPQGDKLWAEQLKQKYFEEYKKKYPNSEVSYEQYYYDLFFYEPMYEKYKTKDIDFYFELMH